MIAQSENHAVPPGIDPLQGAMDLGEDRLKEMAATAEDRSRIYWLLSRFFLEPPGSEFLAELESAAEPEDTASEDGLAAILAQLRQGAREAEGDALRVEYTRLFSGIREGYGPPPPYESLYREGRLYGDATASVTAHYRMNGCAPDEGEAGPEDHLGIELKFLALLCYRESRAWDSGNLPEGRACLEAERAFIDEHLLPWVPAYCAGVEREARSPFYRAVAGLIAESIALDGRQVTGMLGSLPVWGAEEAERGDQP